jgi:hypothetical protein
MIIVLLVVEIVAVANIIVCVSALVSHNADLGLFTGPVALALTLTVFGVSRATTSAARRTDWRTEWRADGRPAHPSANENRGHHGFPTDL